ncbi:MAG: nucleoside triphosphate pyrophosphohydrolase [Oscillospiraceae bacterium]|jgi:tetrapyrrole methylase family protein/MazG family protein|nr:nucleoside triphosphate pyrophosphohydrolase [Oscillospiraceae bacterium]
MLSFENAEKYGVDGLRRIVTLLRGEGGCQWDKEQTHESIRRNFIEEAYEVAEAIDEKSPEHLREELGDVLLQVIFHSSIEEDAGRFDLDDVADGSVRKLLYRHPHVFGDAEVSGTDEILANWDELKKREKSHETVTDSMNAVARSLPALWRAEKVRKKAAKAGFDFKDARAAIAHLRDKLDKLERAAAAGETDTAERELGDVLFSAVNVARKLGQDPEAALGAATDRFIARFDAAEAAASEKNLLPQDLTAEQPDKLYSGTKLH